MRWFLSDRADPRAAALADRHYNRQKIGSPQFVPPGRCLVLLTEKADALWITSWPFADYVKHAWAGAWVCSCFRNENQYNRKNRSGHLSSQLIAEAVAATRWFYGNPPSLGFVTFVDSSKVRSTRPGECYRAAGWQEVGATKINNLLALQLLPDAMPVPCMPNGPRAKQIELSRHVSNLALFAEVSA